MLPPLRLVPALTFSLAALASACTVVQRPSTPADFHEHSSERGAHSSQDPADRTDPADPAHPERAERHGARPIAVRPGVSEPPPPGGFGPGHPNDPGQPTLPETADPGFDGKLRPDQTRPPVRAREEDPARPEHAGPTDKGNPPPARKFADGSACSNGGECASGTCEGMGCGPGQGRCMPAQRACTRDLRVYCGCDGKEFRASGGCPGQVFLHPGACNTGRGIDGPAGK
jgi:hypothetical protein